MYALYVGFFLLIFILAFIWICAAGFFKTVGKIVGKFFEPFKESKEDKDELEK